MKALLKSYEAVIATEIAHVHVHECGGIENSVGAKILLVPTADGKLTVEKIEHFLSHRGHQHEVQPKVITITNATEVGTVYSIAEIKTIAAWAHAHDMYLHMDGSRIANAAASLGCTFKEMTTDAGVDVLSFGGAKNGMMIGEAVVFCNPAIGKDFKYLAQQGLQVASKMRYISAQFLVMLEDNLWLRNAQQANAMASLIAKKLQQLGSDFELVHPTQANEVFVRMPTEVAEQLVKIYQLYLWGRSTDCHRTKVRFITSWATTEDHVEELFETLEALVSK